MNDKNQVETIFAAALKLSPAERSSFLEQECGNDNELRHQVESLLDANQAMGDFLAQTQSQVDGNDNAESSISHSSDSSIHGRFLPGSLVDNRYRIVSLAGRGGMGEVYRADDLKLGQTVALKFLPEGFANDRKRLDYFHQEVRLTRQISHPNVCRVYDIGEVDGQHFLSMEYIDGEDLRTLLRRIGRLPGDKGVEIAQQLCVGLVAAHEKGVLHRDLKPANIMIDGRGHVRITDFGLAKLLDDSEQKEIAGTPTYMAPEQLLKGETSQQSDIYSLGLILAEIFQGTPVYEKESVAELISHYQDRSSNSSVELPSSVDVDPLVERVILACLQRNPEDRPSSARQISQALPGGDPLEAAIAAGTTPSPVLIANAEDKNKLSFKAGFVFVCIIAISLGVSIVAGRKSKRMFETSPQLLSARCAEIIEELGYSDLPKNTRFGAAANEAMQKELTSRPIEQHDAWLEQHWKPIFQFWRRWTDGEFMVEEHHGAFAASSKGPIKENTNEVTVVIDPQGSLLQLKVFGLEPITDDREQPKLDWDDVLALADLQLADATEVDLVTDPPVFCTERMAWEFGTGENKRMIQAGALRGKCNYFETCGINEVKLNEQEVTWMSTIGMAIFSLAKLTFVFLALVNLRTSRADLGGALRASAFIFGLYFIQEVLSLRMKSPEFVRSIFIGLLEDRAFGHMIGHAFHICIIYLGIEPYVRKHWPRSLVGFTRLSGLRWTDPSVGQELLVGVSVGCLGLMAMDSIAMAIGVNTSEVATHVLRYCHPAVFVAALSNGIASAFLLAFVFASFCVIIRIFARRVKFEIAITLFFGFLGLLMFQQVTEEKAWFMLFLPFMLPLIFVVLFLRVGFLAAYIAMFTAGSIRNALPVNPESWYVSYAVIAYAIPTILALLGFVTSQGGVAKLLAQLEPSLEHR